MRRHDQAKLDIQITDVVEKRYVQSMTDNVCGISTVVRIYIAKSEGN